MRMSRRARIAAVVMALLVLVMVVLIMLSARPNPVAHKMADLNAYDIKEPPPAQAVAPPLATNAPAPPSERAAPGEASLGGEASDAAGVAPIAVSIPRLAYAYTLGFRLAGDRIAAAQEAHRALCEQMGLARCQLLAMARGASDDTETEARLKLRVASAEARRFSDALIKTVAAEGGRAIQTSVSAEDVSKEIVDAEARIRQRELLVARLTEILRTRSGKVAELVEAERSVAQAQEELDQTKAWLTELRGRVAMSDFEISYQAAARQISPEVTRSGLGEATWDSGAAFLLTLRALLTLLIYLAPWMLVLGPIGWLVWRRMRRMRDSLPPQAPEG
ncbi:MAG: DUF4349 domain-containing protein [Pseudomonadota bacterium]